MSPAVATEREKLMPTSNKPHAAALAALALPAVCAFAGFCSPAIAEDYPIRPVTLVVPFPPGGSIGTAARIVADKMSNALSQQIEVVKASSANLE
jgi:tripartite-type tricarboxylate transporter receptor subunit TctC